MPSLKRLFDVSARKTSIGGKTLLERMQTAANSTSIFASDLVDDIANDVAAILGDLDAALEDYDGTAPQADAETAAALIAEKMSTDQAGLTVDVLAQIGSPASVEVRNGAAEPLEWFTTGDGKGLLDSLFNELIDDWDAPQGAPVQPFVNSLSSLVSAVEAAIDIFQPLFDGSGGENTFADAVDVVVGRVQDVDQNGGSFRGALEGSADLGATGPGFYPDVANNPLGGLAYDDPPDVSQIVFQTVFAVNGFDAGTFAADTKLADFRAAVATTNTGPGYGGDATNDPLCDLLEYCTDNLAQP